MNRFQIRLVGVLPGADLERAAAELARMAAIPAERAARLLTEPGRRIARDLGHEKAIRVREALHDIGVACTLEPWAPTPEPTAAPKARDPDNPSREDRPSALGRTRQSSPEPARTAISAELGLESMQVRCPSCGVEQPPGTFCISCGVAMDKAVERRRTTRRLPPQPSPTTNKRISRTVQRTFSQVLVLLVLVGILVALVAHRQKGLLPRPDFYDLSRLSEPIQTPTRTQPFQTEAGGVRYSVRPLYDYRLNGVVVSLHDSDAIDDIYHRQDWKDFLNIRDICVVWGDDASSGIMGRLQVRNATWTCWVSWLDAESGRQFRMDQLSNNHLLADDPAVAQAIRSVRVGDQIELTGMLSEYAHDGFKRGTSTSRTDTGNGACETIYVTDFRVVKEAHRGWRVLYWLGIYLAVAALLALVVLIALPVRP